MRLYAYLLLACLAVGARAASIAPSDIAQESVKKLPDTENPSKLENVDSDLQLVDEANTIKDVENKLRVKTADAIPVAVVVEDAEPSLKASEEKEDDIVRPEPDLKNPGPPQRQLHETQNPEHHDSEQQSVLNFKHNINEVQDMLRQGFKGVSEGINHNYDSNNKVNNVHQTIQSLRDGFTSQINKLNDTIHNFLNQKNEGNVRSAENDVSFHSIESALSTLKNNFNIGVKTLTQGVDVVAALRADNDNVEGSDSPTSPVASISNNVLLEYLQGFQQTLISGFGNLTQALNQNQVNKEPPAAGNAPAQADTPVTSQNPFPNWLSNMQNQIGEMATNIQNQFQSLTANIPFPFNNQNKGNQSSEVPSSTAEPLQGIGGNIFNFFQRPTQAPSTAQPSPNKSAESGIKSEESKPQDTVSVAGAVKKLLQNNPISQAVRKVQDTSATVQKINADAVKSAGDVIKVEDPKVQESEGTFTTADKKLMQNNNIKQAVKKVQETIAVAQKINADAVKSAGEVIKVEDQKVEIPEGVVTGADKKLIQNNPVSQAVKQIQETIAVVQKINAVKSTGDVVKVGEQKVEEAKVEEENVVEQNGKEQNVDQKQEGSKGGLYGSNGSAAGDNNDRVVRVEEKNEIVKDEKDSLTEEPKKQEVQENREESDKTE